MTLSTRHCMTVSLTLSMIILFFTKGNPLWNVPSGTQGIPLDNIYRNMAFKCIYLSNATKNETPLPPPPIPLQSLKSQVPSLKSYVPSTRPPNQPGTVTASQQPGTVTASPDIRRPTTHISSLKSQVSSLTSHLTARRTNRGQSPLHSNRGQSLLPPTSNMA